MSAVSLLLPANRERLLELIRRIDGMEALSWPDRSLAADCLRVLVKYAGPPTEEEPAGSDNMLTRRQAG